MRSADALSIPSELDDRSQWGDRFLQALCLLLMGYVLFGHGVAYLGVPPLFVGELALAMGVLLLLATVGWAPVFDVLPSVLLASFMIWGLACTIPHLSHYGVDALRDAVVWGYGMWAIIVGGLLIARPERLRMLMRYYRRFVTVFLFAAPVVWLVKNFFKDALPTLPGSDISIISIKPGDILVHLGGTVAFIAADLAARAGLLAAVLVAINLMLYGRSNRGGLLSFLCAFTLINLLQRRHRWSATVVGAVFFLAILFVLADVAISTGQRRKVSVDQMIENIASIAGKSDNSHLENTKQWRLNWWSDIIHYTVGGQYFWMGKGFGVSLADDDGYQIHSAEGLRSPHSIHFTVLARSGVPGLAVWVLLQVSWVSAVGSALFRSVWEQRQSWASLFAFLLAYWVALICNATFDVYLEGPMGGIWFWCVFGVGLGALWIYRHRPEVLDDQETHVESA